ncbi:hypothetical protein [Streptomyces sp. NRRL S-31]|uniref:hypothetical protein n=1 Tax=Streptomyces sp. NRRL S-31 TaxID=1463898 RepID=UPI0004CB3B79|nr:hypothetical protein [Streptomyces sp. NRRL S-31]
MAIYGVFRTDDVQPGEFVSAVVIAPGVDQARRAVAHLSGVVATGKGRNVKAEKLDTTGATRLVSIYEDERTPEPAEDDPADNYPYDDMIG